MKQNTIILVILVALVTGGAGFFAGVKYQQSRRSAFFAQTGNGQGSAGNIMRNGNRTGFRPVNGEIIKADESSITVKLNDGSSKIVLVSEKTAINKAEKAEKASLKEGETVAVFGTENSDGSVTANSIQLNPISRVPTP